ncbi:hypothetical protein AURDEDRAFT_167174 [Auricularia subglabra TFB-10046 SS5]|nr:hypothetical protein AURDEDRAFT_167174 [Auricularia subglabra TFB-10046 SS5]
MLACGFLKVSWQDASAQFNEPDLLDLAHKDAWLPGLVRPRWTCRDTSDTVKSASPTGAPERVKEIVHLASIGQPLSQARSLVHLLKIIVDAVKVHELLLELDIIHRDLSWFNLLCNPRHDPSALKVKGVRQGIPFIDYILSGEDSEPNCLVVDLDHAALMTQLYADDHDPWKHKCGTPMFVAIEVSSHREAAVGTITRDLMGRLCALDKPKYTDLFARAFPNGDKGFMAAFRKVHERERNRTDDMHDDFVPDCGTNPAELHRARHDMESLFWVTFWALLRASPLCGMLDDDSGGALKMFGDSMLDHKLGDETFRSMLWASSNMTRGMHSLLRERVGLLLRDMAAYVSIPWHRYTATVPDLPQNHAHIAFTRMLIVEIYQISNSGDILLDRKVPRNLHTVNTFNYRDNSSKPKRPLGTGSNPAVRPSQDMPRGDVGRASTDAPGADPARSTHEAASQRGTKRGTDTRDADGDASETNPASKRTKHTARSPEASEIRDISKLVDMIFDDRVLWFGVGDRDKTKARANTQGVVTAQASPNAQACETCVAGAVDEPNDVCMSPGD